MYYNKKHDMELPRRTDPEYKYLENIDDYEYTNSIAFAMLVRTQSFKELFDVKVEDRREKWIEKAKKLGFDTYSLTRDAKFSNRVHFFHKESILKEDTNSYTVEDLGDRFVGLTTLINYYYKRNEIYIKKPYVTDDIFEEELKFNKVYLNSEDFCIPCKDTSSLDERIEIKQINKSLRLRELESDFLSTLTLKDLLCFDYGVVDKFWNEKPTIANINDGIAELVTYNLKIDELYIPLDPENLKKEKKHYLKQEGLDSITALLNYSSLFIPCKVKVKGKNKRVEKMKRISNTILLDEIDESKSKRDEKFTTNIKLSDIDYVGNDMNSSFKIGDIQDGVKKLVDYYLEKKRIYPKKSIDNNKNEVYTISKHKEFYEVLLSPNNYYIPCKKYINSDSKESVLRKISSSLSLKILEERFFEDLNLSTFNFEKNIKVKPIYSLPELKFDEATVIDLPVNIKLPPNELEAYIKKVRELNTELEHPLETMGNKLQEAKKTSAHKEIETSNKKENISDALYIYDVREVLLEKEKSLSKDKKNKISEIEEMYEEEHQYDEIEVIEEQFDPRIALYKGEKLIKTIEEITGFDKNKIKVAITYTNHYIRKKRYNELITGVNTLDDKTT